MAQRSPLHETTAAAGAAFAEAAGWAMPADYGDWQSECRAAAGLFDVSHRGKVEVSGPDAPAFLHNLCTNDVKNLPLGAGCEAFFCNTRAKVLAFGWLYHLRLAGGRNAFWIDVDPGESEKLIRHLDRHIISEAVELADRTTGFAQLHLAGPESRAVLGRALADEVPPLEELQHMERTFGGRAHAHVRRHDPLGLPGFDVVCLNEFAPEVWRRLTAAGAKPAGLTAYDALRTEAGTPVYGRDVTEERFAFDVGRTERAISYAKGCYLGQEPIVMARDRAGHAPRALVGLKLTGPGPAAAGAKVRRDGAEVGFVTSSVESPRLGRPVALAYLRHGHQQPGTAVEVEGRPAEVSALPMAPARE
jgi:tRNA-modifying protein YgfZ